MHLLGIKCRNASQKFHPGRSRLRAVSDALLHDRSEGLQQWSVCGVQRPLASAVRDIVGNKTKESNRRTPSRNSTGAWATHCYTIQTNGILSTAPPPAQPFTEPFPATAPRESAGEDQNVGGICTSSACSTAWGWGRYSRAWLLHRATPS